MYCFSYQLLYCGSQYSHSQPLSLKGLWYSICAEWTAILEVLIGVPCFHSGAGRPGNHCHPKHGYVCYYVPACVMACIKWLPYKQISIVEEVALHPTHMLLLGVETVVNSYNHTKVLAIVCLISTACGVNTLHGKCTGENSVYQVFSV